MIDGRLIKGNETKERIVIATLQLITEIGIKNLSAQKIATRAGVSKSNVFHHFESVDVIPLEAFKYLASGMYETMKIEQGMSVRDMLLALGNKTFHCSDEENKLVRAFFSLYNESFYDQRYKTLLVDMLATYRQNLMENITDIDGPIYEIHALGQLAYIITITMDAYGYQFLINGDRDLYMAMWSTQVDLYMNQLETIKVVS